MPGFSSSPARKRGPGRSRPGEVGSRLMSGSGVGGRPSPGGGRWFSDDCVSRQLLNPGVLSTTALRSEPGTLLPGPSLPCWGLKVFLSVFYSKKTPTPGPLPAFSLWKNFGQRISLIRELKNGETKVSLAGCSPWGC